MEEENGFGRFAGSLDPGAQEFWPAYPPPPPPLYTLIPVPPPPPAPVCYSYGQPPPFSPAPALPPATIPPTRSLLLSSVPCNASESTVRRDLEPFGDVRAVQMGRVREGIVGVHFYDVRAAHAALDHIRHQHMQQQHRLRLHYSSHFAGGAPPPPPPARGLVSGTVVWAQFVVPALNAFPDGHNQGTLVVFNLDSHLSASALAHFFQAFGPIRELRETPTKKHQKFVEFYDVRDAAAALAALNGREIAGKALVIEFSRPGGGHGRRPYQQPPMKKPPSPSPAYPRGCSSGSSQQQAPLAASKKSVVSKAFVKSFSLECSIDDDLSSLKLDSERENNGSHGGPSAVVVTKAKGNPREAKNNSRPWKGKHRSFDPRFLIKEDAIVDPDCRDTRTTVMIKNIPNKYSQKLLLNMLDNHCIHYNEQKNDPPSSYDFVYLPIDFNNKCNVGYGFVNMTSPEAALRLYKSFHQQHWEVFNSRKICEVTYARVQGLEALKEHFKNSKFACETEEYLPVVFSPARDGRAHLTDPLPIVPCCHVTDGGDSTAATTSVSVLSSSPSLSSSDDIITDAVALGAGGSETSSNGGVDYHHHDYDVAG